MDNFTAGQGDWRKRFFLIWTGQAFSIIGSMLVQFALVWYLTAKTGSALVLTTSTLMALLPQVFIGPFAGALVDRWNRKRVMILADGIIALFTLLLVLLFWSGQIQVWHIYVVSFIRALGGAFHFPAMSASTALLVPEKHLARINGINQALNGSLNIIAPPLGAILIGAIPMYAVLSIDILTAALAITPLLFVQIPQPARVETGAVTPAAVLRDVREGLAYVSRFQGLLVILAMAALINFLFNPAFSLMPLLVTRIFKGGAMQLGTLESASGVGVILGGLGLGVWGGFKRKVFTSMSGLVGMGVGTLMIALAPAPAFWLAAAGMLVMGGMNPITNGPLFALLQANIRPEMQGRVFTLVGSFSGLMSPLGMIAAAPVADRLGIQFWYVTAGIAAILMAFSMVMIRPVLRLEDDLQADARQFETSAQALRGAPVAD